MLVQESGVQGALLACFTIYTTNEVMQEGLLFVGYDNSRKWCAKQTLVISKRSREEQEVLLWSVWLCQCLHEHCHHLSHSSLSMGIVSPNQPDEQPASWMGGWSQSRALLALAKTTSITRPWMMTTLNSHHTYICSTVCLFLLPYDPLKMAFATQSTPK